MAKWKKVRNCKAQGKTVGVVVQKVGSQKQVTLLNPHGKFVKATAELRQGVHMTNAGEVKCVKNTGKPKELTSEEIAYRKGYRSAMIDQSKAYKAKANSGNKNNGGKNNG